MDFNTENKLYDWVRGFTVDFDKNTGFSSLMETGKQLSFPNAGMYLGHRRRGGSAPARRSARLRIPQLPRTAACRRYRLCCSIVYPGKVGEEYYMTKGHYHDPADTCEVYYCLSGHGYMMLENEQGDWSCLELTSGRACYVPKYYAHRSICVGKDEPLVTFFTFRADAGHNYGAIETKGYRKLLVERDGKPTIIDNPKWGK